MSSSFLIIGANGQLGKALQAQYPQARTADMDELDITDPGALEAFDWSGIDTILNAAAYTNVDGAEAQDGRIIAWNVNAVAPANLTKIANAKDITLVHISTDYVFDGTHEAHTESELFSPLSVYGASKAAGDIAIMQSNKYYILRTSWVIGDGKNFVRTMLELGQKGISPSVVHDQVGRLTFTSELVKAIDHLLTTKPTFGTYNVSNSGDIVSWADITREIFTEAGFDLQVTNTTTEDYYRGKTGIAPRPQQSAFNLEKVQATGFASTDWRIDLHRYINKELGK